MGCRQSDAVDGGRDGNIGGDLRENAEESSSPCVAKRAKLDLL